MRRIKELLKKNKILFNFVSYLRELKSLVFGTFYDTSRFFKYGGWRKRAFQLEERNYYVMFLYHKVEKSLSYQKRNPESGWKDILDLAQLVNIAYKSQNYGYHDVAAKQVIDKFLELPENKDDPRVIKVNKLLSGINFKSPDKHGALSINKKDLQKGTLNVPEDFFYSRYSLREFDNKPVDIKTIKKGVYLARKTPSVCNRQHWHVYHTSDPTVRDLALELQNGNRGFGHKVPTLLIITSDQTAFFTTNERNQGWIDGGMYLMSLIYAYHSLGVASCALNWSQTPKNDKKLRKRLNIKPSHNIICMLALGYPQEENLVCASSRLPQDDFLSELSIKKDG